MALIKRTGQKRQKNAQESKNLSRADGWNNLLTGLGQSGIDKRMSTTFTRNQRMTQREQTDLYTCDGLAQRIISLPVQDMLREGFRVDGDPENICVGELESLGYMTALRRALLWARLYGGSAIVMGVDDGATDLQQPVNEASIRRIGFLRTYDRYQVSQHSMNLDPSSEKYGTPEVYQVSPSYGVGYYVHSSRILLFDGVDVPEQVRQVNGGWGDSVLQAIYERIRGLGEAYADVESIISEYIIGMLTINNLAELISTGQEKLIQARLSQIDLSKHVINSVLLDSNEKYERASSSTTGLEGLIDKLVQAISAVTGIPVTLLMGESPRGLSATGASDIRFYYDTVSSSQENQLKPQLETLCRYIMLAQEYDFGGVEPDGWKICFNPLWQPTEKEQAEVRKIQAETDAIYITNQVLTPEEVSESRFGGNGYSTDTALMAGRRDPSFAGASDEQ